jgi:hypothetical protein
MRRKLHTPDQTVDPEIIDPEIMQGAIQSLDAERPKIIAKCSVCGADASSYTPEQLCWVCRRLKISAWRDIETQSPVQE